MAYVRIGNPLYRQQTPLDWSTQIGYVSVSYAAHVELYTVPLPIRVDVYIHTNQRFKDAMIPLNKMELTWIMWHDSAVDVDSFHGFIEIICGARPASFHARDGDNNIEFICPATVTIDWFEG